ncbi:MAG: glycoside hydrolase family 88 protein [Bryobacteraceae bacterium]
MLNKLILLLLTASAMASGATRIVAGLTPDQTGVEMWLSAGALEPGAAKRRVLIVGGLNGSTSSAESVRSQLDWFEKSPHRRNTALAAIPLANPKSAPLLFPPTGDAYAANTESHVLWRTIAAFAPDAVLIAGSDPAGLAAALASKPSPFGAVAASSATLREWFDAAPGVSEAHRRLRERLAAKPLDVARQLARAYGHELPQVVYIPAVALLARLRLGALADVEGIAAPFVDGSRDSLEKATSSHLSGHLLFTELYRSTKNPKYLERVRAAADMGFTASGAMKESMPLHNEMSDSVFMGGPILAAAGALTGETKYFDMCVRHIRFMQKLGLRADGLYRHSPLDETAWGRGNAFPALGLALVLSDFPKNHPARAELLAAFRAHIAALVERQEPDGAWRQIIDLPGSYRELSATAMIAFAMKRGIQRRWLEKAKYRRIVDRAWEAVKARTAADGVLLDVCTSTGKQKSRKDYLDRVAIFDRDPRGGAMVMLLATEMAGLGK